MTLKALRKQKRDLEVSARAKLAEITDNLDADAARAIEEEHKRILGEIAALNTKIAEAVRAADPKADEEDDEDGEDAEDEKDSATAPRNANVLTRAHMAELVLIDTQARGLGIELNLADAVTRGEKADDMRKRLFAELAKKSAQKGPTGGGSDVTVLRHEGEGVSEAMELALTQRILGSNGNFDYKPLSLQARQFAERHRKQSEQYMGMGIVDMAAACINYRGRGSYLTSRDVDTILTRAFHSTSDFPNIFTNALNKSLLARYELAAPTYRQISAQRNFNDFRPHPQIRAGDFPSLQPVSETGELQYGTSQDSKETISVSPYGVVFAISRQMMVNDDLGAIDQILGSAGNEVTKFENTTFFAMFNSGSLAGPTLATDSVAVFAAGHGNLAGAGTAVTVAALGSARAALRGMKSLSGIYLNIPPRILLTGPAKETEADQIVTSITPALATSVNPFSGKLTTVVDANITDNSWYVSADPASVPNFVYGFLNGSNGPRTRTFEPFGVQGIKISLEHDFGCGAIDYRGMYRNPGA